MASGAASAQRRAPVRRWRGLPSVTASVRRWRHVSRRRRTQLVTGGPCSSLRYAGSARRREASHPVLGPLAARGGELGRPGGDVGSPGVDFGSGLLARPAAAGSVRPASRVR